MSDNNVLSQEELKEKLKIDDIAADFFKARGIDTPKLLNEYLNSSLEDLDDPNTIPGVYDVINLIEEHMENGSTVTIYGDFDVDGTSALTVMYKALSRIYDTGKINMLPSNRYRDNYGLSFESVDIMKEAGTDLVITLDCGISNHDEIEYAQMNDMDVAIIDHHEEEDPPKVPVVDPKVEQGNYMERELCAAGVAWRVSQALLGDMFEDVLDIVAMATIADVVPLVGENRIIAKEGLKKIRNYDNVNLGIKMLMDQFDVKHNEIEASDIAYFIGPAINAAGRLGSPQPVVKLLNTDNMETAKELAFQLKNTNDRRKDKTKKILKKIRGRINQYEQEYKVIVERAKILKGVVGLVAGDIKEKYGKPVIIIDSKSGKGSARSVAPFDMYKNLKTCLDEGILERAGGHAMAAGLKVKEGNFWKFRRRINELAEGVEFKEQKPDMVVDPSKIRTRTVEGLYKLAPFGKDNPAPFFKAEDIRAQNVGRTYTGEHLKFEIERDMTSAKDFNPFSNSIGNNAIRCIAFGQGHRSKDVLNNNIDIEFEPCFDTYNEDNEIQFIVRDIEKN